MRGHCPLVCQKAPRWYHIVGIAYKILINVHFQNTSNINQLVMPLLVTSSRIMKSNTQMKGLKYLFSFFFNAENS